MIEGIYKILADNKIDKITFNLERGWGEGLSIVIAVDNLRVFSRISSKEFTETNRKEIIKEKIENMIAEINTERK
jgi:hypothetical protein